MFSGLRSDSVALSHEWLGRPGGRFQWQHCTVTTGSTSKLAVSSWLLAG